MRAARRRSDLVSPAEREEGEAPKRKDATQPGPKQPLRMRVRGPERKGT